MSPLRVAAIDLGTNTTRLLVAEVDGERVDEVERRLAITRLGEGVEARRRLLPLPIARVRNTLGEYRRELERLGAERALLVATSAVRDAENGEAFLGEIEWSYGFDTLLLSGDEEAVMAFRGVASRDGAVEPGTLVLDVGGGSTELVLGGPDGVVDRVSLDVGSVRQTELHLRSDPPTEAELDGLRRRRARAAGGRRGAVHGARTACHRRRRDDHDRGGARPGPAGVRPRAGRRSPAHARGSRRRSYGSSPRCPSPSAVSYRPSSPSGRR